MQFYYYKSGQRNGPIDTAKLKELVQQRIIVPDVPVECEGKIYPARKVKGLEFPQDLPELPPVMPEPEPKDEPKDADQPAPVPESAAAGSGGERIIYVQQPSSQPAPAPAPSPAPLPYQIRSTREPRTYLQRQHAESLERLCRWHAMFGWLGLISGILSLVASLICFVAAFAMATNAETATVLAGASGGLFSFGVFSCLGSVTPFFFAALGRYVMSHCR